MVLRKFREEVFVDGFGHVFTRGQFDVNDELREVAPKVDGDGYSSVTVYFSSQFIPYIYKSTMKVATLQWAGILGSFYILAETCDHLTGDKDKNRRAAILAKNESYSARNLAIALVKCE